MEHGKLMVLLKKCERAMASNSSRYHVFTKNMRRIAEQESC
jgi:hypothetical protein